MHMNELEIHRVKGRPIPVFDEETSCHKLWVCVIRDTDIEWRGTLEAIDQVFKVTLPPGHKLVTALWQDADLWYLTRERRPDEKPETFLMQEGASFGVMEGTVTFVEQ